MMAFWYGVAFRVAGILPSWLKRTLARLIACGYFVFNANQRRGVMANVRVMRPDAKLYESLLLSWRTFQQAGLNLVDFFSIPTATDTDIASLVANFGDMRKMLEERSGGKPFCIVTGHYGHWELAGAVLGLGGYRTHAIALTQNSRVVQHFYDALRVRFGMTTHDVRLGLRDLLRSLPEGEVPAIVSDREYSPGGEPVAFFGRTARFPRGAALLAFRKQLVGIPGFLIRQPDGRFLLEFGQRICPDTKDEREWITAFVQDFARQYESVVTRDPTQFLNFFDFWGSAA